MAVNQNPSLSNQSSDVDSRIRDLEAERDSALTQLSDLQVKYDLELESSKQLKDSYDQSRTVIDDLKSETESLKQDITNLESEISNYNQNISNLNEERNQLESRLNQNSSEYKTELKKITAERDRNVKKVNSLEKELERTKNNYQRSLNRASNGENGSLTNNQKYIIGGCGLALVSALAGTGYAAHSRGEELTVLKQEINQEKIVEGNDYVSAVKGLYESINNLENTKSDLETALNDANEKLKLHKIVNQTAFVKGIQYKDPVFTAQGCTFTLLEHWNDPELNVSLVCGESRGIECDQTQKDYFENNLTPINENVFQFACKYLPDKLKEDEKKDCK